MSGSMVMLSQLIIDVRSLARRAHVPDAINTLRAAGLLPRRRGYEDRFGAALTASIRSGDVVWDVGANLGVYTVAFAEQVGPTGRVIAFEPAPDCFRALQARVAHLENVTALNMALGDTDGSAVLTVEANPLGSTHSLLHAGGGVPVRVARGDALVRSGEVPAPDVIKIDVEGFEERVVLGLSEIVRRCRAVLTEVHFAQLDAAGDRHAPVRVERRLHDAGLTVRWVDASHLVAHRGSE